MVKWLWKIILGYIFLYPFIPRPFLSEGVFKNLDLPNIAFLLLAGFYIFKKTSKPPKFTFIDGMISVFFLSLLISLIFSNNFLNSLSGLCKYLSLVSLFYIARISGRKNKNQLIFTLIISATLVSLYSLHCFFVGSKFALEYLSQHKIHNPFAREFLTRNRAFSPFMLPSLLANYLIMIIILCLGAAIQKIKQNKKDFLLFLNLFCLSLCFLTLFFTKSLGGWIALAVSVFTFFILGKMCNKKAWLVIALILVCSTCLFFMRIHGNKNFTKPGFSVHKRISYWKETATIIGQHPLTGVGIGNFYLKETRYAHNSYLQIWAEIGLLGIISWLGIIFIFILKGIENLYKKEESYYKLGIFSGGLAFLVHNLIDLSFFIPQAAFLWWIILGLTFLNGNEREFKDANLSDSIIV